MSFEKRVKYTNIISGLDTGVGYAGTAQRLVSACKNDGVDVSLLEARRIIEKNNSTHEKLMDIQSLYNK